MTRIKEARIKAGLQQKEVALTLGVRAPSICAWESGKTKPTAKNIEALSNLYHVSTDYLLGLSDDPETKKEPAPPGGMRESVMRLFDEIEAAGLSDTEAEYIRAQIEGIKALRKPG